MLVKMLSVWTNNVVDVSIIRNRKNVYEKTERKTANKVKNEENIKL